MKYVIIIPDGAADHPLEEFAGKTPFEAAHIPNMDKLAMMGKQGTVATTPDGFPCGSDVCSMSLLGYSPVKYHKGRAPLEAAALGIALDEADWVFRINFVTVVEGLMQDHSAGAISSNEGQQLLADFVKLIDDPDIKVYPGVSYRNILVDQSNRDGRKGRDWSKLKTTPPHDIPGESKDKHRPTGPHAALLNDLIDKSDALFGGHEVNLTRRDLGEAPATHIWPWGQGQKPIVPTFESRFGLKGAMITAVDLLAGIASFIGWDRLDVPGQTSYHHDQDYAVAGERAIEAIDDYDVVCVHVEAPDEASHQADSQTKVAAIQAIDKHIVGPIHKVLEERNREFGGYRILVLPDHYTSVATRKHDPTPPPFIMAGKHISNVVSKPFNEHNAQHADLHIKHGHELMEFFLNSGK